MRVIGNHSPLVCWPACRSHNKARPLERIERSFSRIFHSPEGPVRTNRTIGMSQVKFGELLRRVEGLVTWDKGAGRPRGLTLAQGLKATLMYFKNNITEEVIAELVFVSQSVISETTSTLDGVIVEALQDFEPDPAEAAEGLAGRVAVIDGSLHPCWSWKGKKDLWSGKHTAPRRRRVVDPTQSGGIGGTFVGLMPNLAPKVQGGTRMEE